LQQTPALGSPWAPLTDPVVIESSGNNQVVIPVQAGTGFYRLATP
jgi:hypothetical protein